MEDLDTLASDDAKAAATACRVKAAAPPAGNGKSVGFRKPLLYCVKWEGCSYRRRSWETEEAVRTFGAPKLLTFKRRHAADPALTTAPCSPNFLIVDRVVDTRQADPVEDVDAEEEVKPLNLNPNVFSPNP
jgi:chromodomain-helicase-DNA-binding protein 7